MDTSNWITTEANPINIHTPSNNCPQDENCWEICNGYIYRKPISTKGYNNISLQFNLRPRSMNNDNEYCSFQYKYILNNNNNSNWTEFYQYGINTVEINNHTVYLPNSTWDNHAVTIGILALNGNGDCCWMSQVYLKGIQS